MWELQRKCIFIEKKLQKDLVESEKSSTFALAFKNDAWLIRLRIRLEGWVSGWNQQFAKLPYWVTGTEGSNPSDYAITM